MRIGVVAYTFYESDSRVLRYAEALAHRGDSVDVIALRRTGQCSFEVINDVRVHRIQERTLNERAKLDYAVKIVSFFMKSALLLSKMMLKKKFDLLHIHSVPDFLVFASLLPKLAGAKVILDIHDILPEFYLSKFNGKKESPLFKGLLAVEKASAAFSDHVIIANHLWEKKLTSRSLVPRKCTTILNYPDRSIFHQKPRTYDTDKFVVMYPGTLNWHQGLDIAVRAAAKVRNTLPSFELHIYGEGDSKNRLKELVRELGLEDIVHIRNTVPLRSIAELMANASMGIVPKRRDSFGNEAFSTKILEFMSLGVPVLVADTDIDRYYFNDDNVKFFKSGDVQDLADSIICIAKNKSMRESIIYHALNFVNDMSWDKKKYNYLNLVDNLVSDSH